MENVQDTGSWIASVRAKESLRKDSIINDPFAGKLSGKVGQDTLQSLPLLGRHLTTGGTIARTKWFDDTVQEIVNSGASAIINLASGLDTRSARIHRPRNVKWVDVDFPKVIAYKKHVAPELYSESEVSTLEADLSTDEGLNAVRRVIEESGPRVCVITEGLLVYLSPTEVNRLVKTFSCYNVKWWVSDFYSQSALTTLRLLFRQRIQSVNLDFTIPKKGLSSYFSTYGWEIARTESELRLARLLNRLPLWLFPLSFLKANRIKYSGKGNIVSYALFTK